MDILLTHGYFLAEDQAERRIMKPYPPLGILYISAYLKSKGFAVGVFDSTFASEDTFRTTIETVRPSVVGIYVNLMTRQNALRLMAYCKSKGCVVVVGGPEVGFHAEQFIGHGADVAVIGEGEKTLEHLLPVLAGRDRTALREIHGIAYLDDQGVIRYNPPQSLIPDLDLLPLPDREAIDMHRYVRTWREAHGRGSVSLLCARGCPFTCTWCSRSVFGETHRRRTPARVVDEIELIMAEYKPDQLWFADDVFTIQHRWFHDFYAEMKRRNLSIPFECISRADRLNEEILMKMREIGSFRIWYGSESGSQRILDAMKRHVTVDQIRTVTRLARKHGIESGLFVMLGYPGEEITDIDATIDHLVETNPDAYLTTIAYPIKGTEFYHEVENSLRPNGAWDQTTDRSLDFTGRHSRRFYWFATRHVTHEVNCRRPGHPMRRLVSFSKSKIARLGMKLTLGEKS